MQRLATILVLMLAAGSAQAATWYVRPLSQGEYGAEDGTSYANAYDGFSDITWGEGGVVAGDTLYICGEHRYATSGADFTTVTELKVGAAGAAGNYITIRGDYASDPGSIIYATRVLPTPGTWAELHPGVFVANSATAQMANLFQLEPTPVMLATASTTATVVATDGSVRYTGSQVWYNPVGDGWTSATIPRYFHTPIQQVIDLQGNSYIKVIGLTGYGGGANRGVIVINNEDSPTSFVEIRDCHLQFGLYTGIYANRSTSDVIIDGNTIKDCTTGTYTIGNGGSSTVYPFRRWTFSGNTVGATSRYARLIGVAADRHALGGQELEDCVFEDNLISDWPGDGILNYVNSRATGKNNIIRRNVILNLADPNSDFHHYGIAITGSNADNWSTRTQGNQIYNNIVWGCTPGAAGAAAGDGAAIRLKGKWFGDHRPLIYGNTIGDSVIGLMDFTMTGYTGSGFIAKNNLFTSNTTHIWLDSGNTVEITSDYNLFHPDGAGRFNYQDTALDDFAAWKVSSGGDAASVLADPTLTGDGYDAAGDFMPLAGSPAIDAGVAIEGIDGLLTDYAGVTRGAAWDIGAYEYVTPAASGGFNPAIELMMRGRARR
jgi:hypothetical protein